MDRAEFLKGLERPARKGLSVSGQYEVAKQAYDAQKEYLNDIIKKIAKEKRK